MLLQRCTLIARCRAADTAIAAAPEVQSRPGARRYTRTSRGRLLQMTAPAVASTSSPGQRLFSFGLIADVQHADIPDGASFHGTPRYYRHSLDILKSAVAAWREERDVSFAVHLGDIVDGNARSAGEETLRRVAAEFDALARPHYHLIGNHCLYACSRPVLSQHLRIPTAAGGASFYSFSPHAGWRIVVLDSFDLAVIGWPEQHPNRVAAAALLAARNRNANKNSPDGLQGLEQRFVAFGGGISAAQLGWLDAQLRGARAARERVLLLSHVPLHPGAAPPVCLSWNYDEVLRLLGEHAGVVVAALAGHTHEDGYARDEHGVHHRTLSAALECPPGDTAYATLDVYADRLVLRGRGRVASAEWLLPPLPAEPSVAAAAGTAAVAEPAAVAA